jgi:predicted nucleic acid-binding protein
MDEVLIDTNILVYAHDPAEAVKRDRAIEVLDALTESGLGRVSAQIVGEFIAATTKGRRPILTLDRAAAQASMVCDAFPVFDLTRFIVLEAARGVRQHQLSDYDAQIWATARMNQVPTIFTEDFESGRRIEGVQFLDPLRPEFDLSPWR